MKIIATETYKLPDFLVCPLEYGDIDHLNEEDIEAYNNAVNVFDEFVNQNNGSHYTIEYDDEEPYFTWSPDFCKLGCTVVDATVYVFAEEQTP